MAASLENPNSVSQQLAAFDAVAADYDRDFTQTELGHMLRRRVWQSLAESFEAGQHVLEIACGTGEDAVWLARQGVRVTATDGSAKMIAIVQGKAERQSVGGQVKTLHCSIEEIVAGRLASVFGPAAHGKQRLFDGAFTNFGGLNTVNVWHALAEALAGLVKPGGKVIVVPMGPYCPWEVTWYLTHGQPRRAFRRLGDGAQATIGGTKIQVWYPSSRRLSRDFSLWFSHVRTMSLGIWLPPTYLKHLVARWPALFAGINRIESRTSRLTGGWGDHYLMELERQTN